MASARSGSGRRSLRRGLVAGLVPVLVLTGCGRLSKKEFIRRADAICRATNTASDRIPIPPKTDVPATADYLRRTSQLLMAQDDQLSALKAPDQDEPRLTDVFRRQRDALGQLENAANQYQLGDTTSAQSTVQQANTALAEIRQDLQGYGFIDCANQ